MNSDERREFELDFTGPPKKIDYDFQAIRIRVYKNGDERDPGKVITVTRREYKHWIIFLDALTRKLGTTTAVHKLFTTTGIRVEHFTELENNGEYVAVERGPFIDCNYGISRMWTHTERRHPATGRAAPGKTIPVERCPASVREFPRSQSQFLPRNKREEQDDDVDIPANPYPLSSSRRYSFTKWTSLVRVTESKPTFLNSGDSMDLYLKNQGYGSTTGLAFPMDGLSRSPNISAMNLGSMSKDKVGGSMEQLNKAGKEWNEDSHTVSMANLRVADTKEKGGTREQPSSMTNTRLPRLIGIDDDTQRSRSQKPTSRLKENERLPPIKRSEQPPPPPLPAPPPKEKKQEVVKREEPRGATRDMGRPKQIQKIEEKKVEETKDVTTEYSVIDKPPQSWESGSGTVYEKKETMHEVVKEDKPVKWQETARRSGKMTEVIRTYEKVHEYTRIIDEYDPDFVD